MAITEFFWPAQGGGGGGVTWPLLAPDGSLAAPSYSFDSDSSLGLYYLTSGYMGVGGNVVMANGKGIYFRNSTDDGNLQFARLSGNSLTLGISESGVDTTFNAYGLHINNLDAGSTTQITDNTNEVIFAGHGTGTAIKLTLYNGDNSFATSIRSPAALAANWSLTLPDGAPASDGLVLTGNMDGTTSWEAGGGGNFWDQVVPNATPVLARNAANSANLKVFQSVSGNKIQFGTYDEGVSTDIYGQDIFIAANNAFNILSIAGQINIIASGGSTTQVGFSDADQSNYVRLRAPSVIATNFDLILPYQGASAAGQPLQADLAGNLTFGLSALQLFTAASDPGSPAVGQVYYNTGTNKIKVYTGSGWETVTSI